MEENNKHPNLIKDEESEKLPTITLDDDIEQFLDSDFEEAYKCDVEIDDILSQTDYFDKKPKTNIFLKFFQTITRKPYSYYAVTVLCLLIGFAGILIGSFGKHNDYIEDQPYNEYLTYKEVEIINSNTITNEYIPSNKVDVDLPLNIYIFRGITQDNKLIYFIKYDSNGTVNNIEVLLNNNKIYLTDDMIQILTIKDNFEAEYDNLILEFKINNVVSSHELGILKFK